MEKLRLALIGCGRVATVSHSKAIIENSKFIDCVALCDIRKEKAESMADKLENSGLKRPEIYVNYKEILRRNDIDAVVIATESGKHYQIAIDAMNHGKHVLVEKPMALSTREMDEMIELSESKNLKLEVCFQNRFNPPIQELRKKIENNAFGKIFYGHIAVRWNRNESYYLQADWRGTWEMDGGVLMNQSIHGIDLLQWMLSNNGEVVEIYGKIANQAHPYIETEDLGIAIIRFANGSYGIIEATSNVYPKNLEETLSIFGEKGTVVIGGLAVNRIEVWRFPQEDSHPFMNLPDPETVYGSGHIHIYKDFHEAISKDRKPYIDGREGKKAVEIILGIYKSQLENTAVSFPVEFDTKLMKNFFER
ncbi:MAG: UDP-N-acetyl-2-amino-2-deoxyglucuronate dehydrogenase [Thermotogaceae bacterium]|jgi:predicted dehydrogenase|nr:UDP-N-acetyl-2-amino-2-deoxyglucuronate dehydrogenase [Thermotogaceae bacterium]MDN5337895.1 UDP-N-acetyl-2-amino-2-deoxyglucuronate dehydrogenase [Thermotogaceae bacterium]